MAGRSNVRAVNRAFKNFEKVMYEKSLKWVCSYAQSLIYKAIEFRLKDQGAHNYTGNLLNSIVSAVYYDGELKQAFFSGETGIRQPRYYEMTASYKGTGHYYFKVDYEGKESYYEADIETLHRKGIDDAYEFISLYQPKQQGFVVVVAYTTEYASFVEQQRRTTGFLSTRNYAAKLGRQYFQLPQKAA